MTYEVRLAKEGEIPRQKEIWKLCFGDYDEYIDFFYSRRYREDRTALLLQDGVIVSMLTMIPVQTVFPDYLITKTAMLYAIATHPACQKRGLATRLMDFAHEYLREFGTEFAVLVPAGKELFDFYSKQNYRTGFYLREARLTLAEASRLGEDEERRLDKDEASRLGEDKPPFGENVMICSSGALTPGEYNRRRESLLQNRLYIAYSETDIACQKELSKATGADIYGLDISSPELDINKPGLDIDSPSLNKLSGVGEIRGCFAAERISPNKVLVKELLIPEDFLALAIREIVRRLPAQEYLIRTPPHLGKQMGGKLRSFGVFRALDENRGLELLNADEGLGYLGFAFD